jgi:CRP-like cAMP-binding protein
MLWRLESIMKPIHTALPQLFTDSSRQMSYDRGDVIIRAGDMPSGVYLIIAGWIKVYNLCEDGEQNIIMSLATDDIFPLEWAVSGNLHDVSFMALEPTTVLRISQDLFRQNLLTSPPIAQAALQKLALYFFQLSNQLEHLPYRSARERVAFRLVSLAADFGKLRAEHVTLMRHIPNDYIARSTNMTRETASREISWLTKRGFIERRNDYIIIKNLPALKKEVGKSFGLSSGQLPA